MYTAQIPIGRDVDGEKYKEDWHYASIIGCSNTCKCTHNQILNLVKNPLPSWSQPMCHLLPLREIAVNEIHEHMGMEMDYPAWMKSKVFEDNNGYIAAATSPKITLLRSKYIGTQSYSLFKEQTQDHGSMIEIFKRWTPRNKKQIFFVTLHNFIFLHTTDM